MTKDEFLVHFGKRVAAVRRRRRRDDRRITAGRLAAMVGLTAQFWSKVECGRVDLKLTQAALVAHALGVSIAYLIRDDEK